MAFGQTGIALRAERQASEQRARTDARQECKTMNLNSVNFARPLPRPACKNRRSHVVRRAKVAIVRATTGTPRSRSKSSPLPGNNFGAPAPKTARAKCALSHRRKIHALVSPRLRRGLTGVTPPTIDARRPVPSPQPLAPRSSTAKTQNPLTFAHGLHRSALRIEPFSEFAACKTRGFCTPQ